MWVKSLLLAGCVVACVSAEANVYLPPEGPPPVLPPGVPGVPPSVPPPGLVARRVGVVGLGGVPIARPGLIGPGPGRPAAAAAIISLINDNDGDGNYRFSYETENGIQAEEQGQVQDDGAEGVLRTRGAFAFTAPDDGRRYELTYTADENGFVAQADHLPTPPPVPAEILRALEQNAADEANGVLDDGQYRPGGPGGPGGPAVVVGAGGYRRGPERAGYQY